MPEKRELRVRPIYGWGWYFSDGKSANVPAPFTLSAEILDDGSPASTMLGKADAADHPLDGLWILLTLRSHGSNGYPPAYNLRATTERPHLEPSQGLFDVAPILTGFAEVPN